LQTLHRLVWRFIRRNTQAYGIELGQALRNFASQQAGERSVRKTQEARREPYYDLVGNNRTGL
jgi:hypothetical protein